MHSAYTTLKFSPITVKWRAVVGLHMSVSGTCQICGEREITDDCGRCGRLVCDVHFDESLGYCTECATEVRGTKEPTPQRQPDDDDDIFPDEVERHQS